MKIDSYAECRAVFLPGIYRTGFSDEPPHVIDQLMLRTWDAYRVGGFECARSQFKSACAAHAIARAISAHR